MRAFLTDEAWAEAAFPGPGDGLPEQGEGNADLIRPWVQRQKGRYGE